MNITLKSPLITEVSRRQKRASFASIKRAAVEALKVCTLGALFAAAVVVLCLIGAS